MIINLKKYLTLRKLSYKDIETDKFKNYELLEYLKSEELVEEKWTSPMLTPQTKCYYHLLPNGRVAISAFRGNALAHIINFALSIAAILISLLK